MDAPIRALSLSHSLTLETERERKQKKGKTIQLIHSHFANLNQNSEPALAIRSKKTVCFISENLFRTSHWITLHDFQMYYKVAKRLSEEPCWVFLLTADEKSNSSQLPKQNGSSATGHMGEMAIQKGFSSPLFSFLLFISLGCHERSEGAAAAGASQ